MSGKEWREVSRQSLYFLLAMAAMVLLLGGVDLLVGMLGAAPARPLEGEKLAIIFGLWLLVFSMFMGLAPFAMDSKQKGMEYLLTLPLSRRRLLGAKFLPRLAAVVLFYLVYSYIYAHVGQAAFGGGFLFFSLSYFSLFLVSFSLAVVDENFIVQSICAGLAMCGYLAACLFIVGLGFSWKFGMPVSWRGMGAWQELAFDPATLAVSVLVFLLMALPFVLSLFWAFDRFDLKPVRAFNRRQLLIFAPLLLLAIALSLGATYLVQGRLPFRESGLTLLSHKRMLAGNLSGRLTLFEGAVRRMVDTRIRPLWARPLLEEGERLFLSGIDGRDGSRFIGRLGLADMSWKVLHRCPGDEFAAPDAFGYRPDGEGFVFLRRGRNANVRGKQPASPARQGGEVELVRLDLDGSVRAAVPFWIAPPRRNDQPRFIGGDQMGGQRFWLVANPERNILRLWEDGRRDDLGPSNGHIPVFSRGLLFSRGGRGMTVRRLSANGSETIGEIEGPVDLGFAASTSVPGVALAEMYGVLRGRIVRIDTATLAVGDVGPGRGLIFLVAPGDFYYVEFESWPAGNAADAWKKLYRLRDGKMTLLRRFDFGAAGYGQLMVERHGVLLVQHRLAKGVSLITRRAFAFPDLDELKPSELD